MKTIQLGVESFEIQLTNRRVTTPAIVRLDENSISIQVIVPDDNYIEITISLIDDCVAMTTRNYTGIHEVPRREVLYRFDRP